MRQSQNILLGGFLSVTFLPFTHTIYTLITHKCKRGHSERKTLDRFSTIHTPIFQRENYSSLVRNHFSLFSLPLPLSYLERRFVPKHNPHLFRMQRVFCSLGSFGNLPKEAGEAWWMQSCVLRDSKSQRRHGFVKSVGSRSLEDSSTLGRLGLKGLLLSCTPTLFSSGSIITWGAVERFFTEFFSFLFDNMYWCYLMFASLFPYSCALLLLFIVHVYELEQYQLLALIYSYFRTQFNLE